MVLDISRDGLEFVAFLPENHFFGCHTATSMVDSNTSHGNFVLSIAACWFVVRVLLLWCVLLPDLE